MEIGGVQKTSLIDYPGKIAMTIFVNGCNFRCPYCQNPDLIKKKNQIPESEILEGIKSRLNFLDGICIGGGEPTLQPDLLDFVKKIKELGLKVKIDTNGTRPDVIEKLIPYVDYFAMDIKAPPEKYAKVVKASVDIRDIERSISLIRNSGKEYEFRTTVVPTLLEKEDIIKIADLIAGAEKYYLQQFRPDVVLDKSFSKIAPYTQAEFIEMRDRIKKIVKYCGIRGL